MHEAIATATVPPVHPARQVVIPHQPIVKSAPVVNNTKEIILKEVSEVELEMDGEGEEEVEYDDDLSYDDEGFEEEDERYTNEDEIYRYSPSPEAELIAAVEHANAHNNSTDIPSDPASTHSDTHSNLSGHSGDTKTTSRKRGSDELDLEQSGPGCLTAEEENEESSPTKRFRRRPDGTPPKRARLDDEQPTLSPATHAASSNLAATHIQNPSSVSQLFNPPITDSPTSADSTPRTRKRSSEEVMLDDGGGIGRQDSDPQTFSSKRIKVDLERPRSLAPPLEGLASSNTVLAQSLVSTSMDMQGDGSAAGRANER